MQGFAMTPAVGMAEDPFEGEPASSSSGSSGPTTPIAVTEGSS